MASASAKLLVLVATSGFLWEPISCGWLQKRQDIQYANILLPAEGASNSTYQIPSLTPLPPDPAAATTPPPSPAPGGSSDPSLAEDPPGIAASSSAIEASVVTPVTAAASSDPAAAANSSPGCTPYEPCNLFFQVSLSLPSKLRVSLT